MISAGPEALREHRSLEFKWLIMPPAEKQAREFSCGETTDVMAKRSEAPLYVSDAQKQARELSSGETKCRTPGEGHPTR